MKRLLVVAVVVAALGGALLAFASTARAQGPRARDDVFFPGGGSSIGVTIRELTAEEAAKANATGGVAIESVREGTPAARAGLRGGDIVLEFDGERVRSTRQFSRLVRETPEGRAVRATVLRDGSRQTLEVTPDRQRAQIVTPPDIAAAVPRVMPRLPRDFDFNFDFDLPPDGFSVFTSPRRLGATLTPLGDQLAGYFGVKEGVLVSSVEENSAAAAAGLRAGDVITSINGTRVDAPGDVARALRDAEPGSGVELTVTREKKELTVRVTTPERQQRRPGERVPA